MNEEKKINDDFEMIDFEEATDDNIETLDETSNNSEEIKGTIFDNDSTQNQDTEGTVIDVNRLFDVHEKEEQIAEEETKKDNRILKIQVGLIVALVLIASLVYFFGYDLLEPFIKID